MKFKIFLFLILGSGFSFNVKEDPTFGVKKEVFFELDKIHLFFKPKMHSVDFNAMCDHFNWALAKAIADGSMCAEDCIENFSKLRSFALNIQGSQSLSREEHEKINILAQSCVCVKRKPFFLETSIKPFFNFTDHYGLHHAFASNFNKFKLQDHLSYFFLKQHWPKSCCEGFFDCRRLYSFRQSGFDALSNKLNARFSFYFFCDLALKIKALKNKLTLEEISLINFFEGYFCPQNKFCSGFYTLGDPDVKVDSKLNLICLEKKLSSNLFNNFYRVRLLSKNIISERFKIFIFKMLSD